MPLALGMWQTPVELRACVGEEAMTDRCVHGNPPWIILKGFTAYAQWRSLSFSLKRWNLLLEGSFSYSFWGNRTWATSPSELVLLSPLDVFSLGCHSLSQFRQADILILVLSYLGTVLGRRWLATSKRVTLTPVGAQLGSGLPLGGWVFVLRTSLPLMCFGDLETR